MSRGPKRLAVVIGDACGRGSEGARLVPFVLEPLAELAAGMTRPGQLLEALNRRVIGRLGSDRFVTGAALELDAELGTLTIANAGHVPAMLRTTNGEVRLIGRASGPPLGIFDDSRYLEESYNLRAGDIVVSMTDGVLESVETDLSGMPTLRELVSQSPGSGDEIHRRVLSRVPPAGKRVDDMSLLSLEWL